MSDVELIVAALTAGMTAGVTSTASAAVQDAYAGLRDAVRRLFSRNATDDEGALALLDSNTAASTHAQEQLATALSSAGAAEDEELIALARRVLTLIKPAGRTGKYVMDLREAKGTQVGDGNTQTVHFH